MTDVVMPQLGETVADGTVTKWFKAVGDLVERGEPLFEVSTDKVDTEIPAPSTGVVSAIYVAEGETVDVGTKLAVIGDDASSPKTVTAPNEPATIDSPSTPNGDSKEPTGRETRLSPVVRRLISEHRIDVASVTGTGPDGRITRADVEAVIVDTTPSDEASRAHDDEHITFSRIRRLTAEHMVRSKATSAHTLMARETDFENVERARRAYGAAFKDEEGFSLTYLAFNALAALVALRDFPHLNASVGNDELIVHRHFNLGIAVDLEDEGLVVPVIRDADRLNVRGLARAIHGLADKARSKKLTMDDMAGATFTITNPGPYGTMMTGAIINQPQVAILSTDAITRKPVVVTIDGSEALAIHSVGLLALSFDHRAIDGAYAARFLRRTNEILTTRDWAPDL
ncbi:MAG: dihydrolipoamide acetyltransferase family protein [Acidimicrobiales bacterium]